MQYKDITLYVQIDYKGADVKDVRICKYADVQMKGFAEEKSGE